MGLDVKGYPQVPGENTVALRAKLISEEAKEVSVALEKGKLESIAQ